jgi:hypothetical protein
MFIFISVAGIIIGIFLTLNPARAIELQRRFYLLINWKIEPVSMEKELRNTRLMGLFLIGLSIFIFILALIGI